MWSSSKRINIRVLISPPSPFIHRSQSPKGKKKGEETPANSQVELAELLVHSLLSHKSPLTLDIVTNYITDKGE